MPFADSTAIHTEQDGEAGFSAQSDDQPRMETVPVAHARDPDGSLPSGQVLISDFGKSDPEYFPLMAKRHRPIRPLPDCGEAAGRTARPDAYTRVQRQIGLRIKWARKLVESNRAAFARDMRVDRTTLQKIEDGTRVPSVFHVLDIARRLRVSTDYILNGTLVGCDLELAQRLWDRHADLRRRNADIQAYIWPDDGSGRQPTRLAPPKRTK